MYFFYLSVACNFILIVALIYLYLAYRKIRYKYKLDPSAETAEVLHDMIRGGAFLLIERIPKENMYIKRR